MRERRDGVDSEKRLLECRNEKEGVSRHLYSLTQLYLPEVHRRVEDLPLTMVCDLYLMAVQVDR